MPISQTTCRTASSSTLFLPVSRCGGFLCVAQPCREGAVFLPKQWAHADCHPSPGTMKQILTLLAAARGGLVSMLGASPTIVTWHFLGAVPPQHSLAGTCRGSVGTGPDYYSVTFTEALSPFSQWGLPTLWVWPEPWLNSSSSTTDQDLHRNHSILRLFPKAPRYYQNLLILARTRNIQLEWEKTIKKHQDDKDCGNILKSFKNTIIKILQ